MIFDPFHGQRKAQTKCMDPKAEAEHAQGKQISKKANEPYAAETAAVCLAAKHTLLSKGQELVGCAKELYDQGVRLSALVAAIEVGAYKNVARDLERNSVNGDKDGAGTTTFQMTSSLADVANTLSQVLSECDYLTSHAKTYAKRHLELAVSDSECGLGSAKDKIDEYIRLNCSRPIEKVESNARWLIDNFEQIMRDLGACLDVLVGFLNEIKANEYDFILQLLRCEPSRDWNATSKLVKADQEVRNQLLKGALSLRSTIQGENLSSLISPVMKLRAALLADTRE
jgi:hypothetical protein